MIFPRGVVRAVYPIPTTMHCTQNHSAQTGNGVGVNSQKRRVGKSYREKNFWRRRQLTDYRPRYKTECRPRQRFTQLLSATRGRQRQAEAMSRSTSSSALSA